MDSPMNKQKEIAKCRERFVWFIFGMLVMGLTVELEAASYYENEPKSSGYDFVVSQNCPSYVHTYSEIAAKKYSDFIPTKTQAGVQRNVGFDGVSIITCVDSFADTNSLRIPCWNDRGLLACNSELYSDLDDAVIGRATWWRESSTSKVLLECDIQLDPQAIYLQRVVFHEFGHCMGLSHTPHYIEAFMFSFLLFNGGFHHDDITGLCYLYGCTKDIADDFGNLVIQKAIILGKPEVWTGVISVKNIIHAEEVK